MKIQNIYERLFISKYIDLILIKYFFVGLINTLISFGSFSVLYYIGFHYFIVSMLNLILGVGISYYNHRKFTFSKSGDFLERFTPIALIYFIITNIILYVADSFGFNIYITYLFILLPLSLVNYFVLKLYVFK